MDDAIAGRPRRSGSGRRGSLAGTGRFAARLAGHLARGLAMIWVVTTFTFFLVRLMPGDPVQVQVEKFVEQGMSQDEAQAQAAVAYGFLPHGSPVSQYLHYLWRLLHFDL